MSPNSRPMVGSALAKIELSREPMNTGSSTPSTISKVSRCVSVLVSWDGVWASIALPLPRRGRGHSALGPGLGVLNCLPDREWRRRHGDVADAVVAQRIENGADHDSERRRGAAFATGLDAERIGWRQHLDDFGFERRQIVCVRHAVVHE